MEHILSCICGEQSYSISASSRISILDNLRDSDVPAPDAPCSGAGTCHKCTVTVTGKIRNLDTGCLSAVNCQDLLACRYAPEGDLTVVIPNDHHIEVVTSGTSDITPSGKNGLGLAIDIGTTTIAAFLYDLSSGKCLARTGERNSQRVFGADVISRITACKDGKLHSLSICVRKQIEDLALSLCKKCQESISSVSNIVIAGNTVMQHLFAELSPESIGVAPFEPSTRFGKFYSSEEFFTALPKGVPVYICPCISGYVGGDITAGLMATSSLNEDGLRLFVDIGTNGEMALGNKDGYITCATAAGPAFEGAEITCGMSGTTGAVDKVSIENGDVAAHVIGEGKPLGICGSGLIDAIAVMLELGVITDAGRLVNEDELPEGSKVGYRIFKREDGHNAFRIRGDVFISAEDIREVQLAKAAIRAGAETLLQNSGKKVSDITSLIIAGGFGAFLNKYSALRIGLLPEVDAALISHAGNTAGAGASKALTDSGMNELNKTTEKCTYLELSTSPEFMDNYIEFMAF